MSIINDRSRNYSEAIKMVAEESNIIIEDEELTAALTGILGTESNSEESDSDESVEEEPTEEETAEQEESSAE